MTQIIIDDPIDFRNNIREILKNILITYIEDKNEFKSIDLNKIYTNLEIGIYNYSIQKAKQKKGIIVKWTTPAFVQIYTDHLRTILYNLDKYDEIKKKLINGEILSKDFVFMNHQEWDPLKWKPLIEEKIKRDNMKYNKKIQASTDMFTCKKCHNNKCTYYEMQTRSADESATIFVNCLTCGKNWRE